MDENIQKEIKERFDVLPERLQEAILSQNLKDHLDEIFKKHRLLINQAATLETFVIMVLLGIRPVKNSQNRLVNELGVSPSRAEEIFMDVDKMIIEPVRQYLVGLAPEGLDDLNKEDSHLPHNDEMLNELKSPAPVQSKTISISGAINEKKTETEIITPYTNKITDFAVLTKAAEKNEVPPNLSTEQINPTVTSSPKTVSTTPTTISPQKISLGAVNKSYPTGVDPYAEPIE